MTTHALKLSVIAALSCLGAACATSPAEAGEWRLVASRCPDLVEDRRDRQITWSRADLREDARDVRITRCPASAFVYVPQRGAQVGNRAWNRDVVIRYTPGGRYAVVDRRGRPVDVRIVAHLHL